MSWSSKRASTAPPALSFSNIEMQFDNSAAISASLGLRPQDRFANPRGYALAVDGLFCRFRIDAPRASGVYGWFVDDELVYIGRAANLRNRLSDQYGRVSPRHPYAGGQLQKCRMNARINQALAAGSIVAVKWIATPDYVSLERELIGYHRPKWNIR